MSGTKAPLFAAIKEGRRLGKAAHKIAHQDIEALMRRGYRRGAGAAEISASPKSIANGLAILQGEGIAREQLTLSRGAAAGRGAQTA